MRRNVDNGEGMYVWGHRVYGKPLCLLLKITVNVKILQKEIKFIIIIFNELCV